MKTILVDAYNTVVTEDGFDEMLYRLLEEFDNPKIVVTNANAQQQQKLQLVDLPYPLFTQSQDPKKDNPAYWDVFFPAYQLTKESVVYFEHSADAVACAKEYGITAYHFNHEVRDYDALRAFLRENL